MFEFKLGDIVKEGVFTDDTGVVVGFNKATNGILVKWPKSEAREAIEKEVPYDKLIFVKRNSPNSTNESEEGNDDNSKDDLEVITTLNQGKRSAMDIIKAALGGDKFVPAFAGYTKAGYHKDFTSLMQCSIEDRIAEKPELGVLDGNGYGFEPIVTQSLTFHNVARRTDELIHFPAGVIPIFGTTGSGKSTLAYFLAKTLKAEFIRFGEPEIPSIHSPRDVMAGCHDFLNNEDSKFLVIDSFRPFMFLDTEKASMGKGGVNNALYMDFTALSSLASWAGKTIFIVINPLAFNKDDIETVRSNLESSTIGLLHTTEYGQFNFVSRTKSNNRIPILYSTDYDSKSVEHNKEEEDVDVTNDLVIGKLDYKSGVWNKVLNKLN